MLTTKKTLLRQQNQVLAEAASDWSKAMTVKELRLLLADLSPNTPVGILAEPYNPRPLAALSDNPGFGILLASANCIKVVD